MLCGVAITIKTTVEQRTEYFIKIYLSATQKKGRHPGGCGFLCQSFTRFLSATPPLYQKGCLITDRSVTGLENGSLHLYPGVPISFWQNVVILASRTTKANDEPLVSQKPTLSRRAVCGVVTIFGY
jgi:hypothetical protein